MIKTIFRNISQLRGFHTNRKIVVIESDDWGSIRTHSKEAREILLLKLPNLSRDPYFNFDILESQNDLHALFEVLVSVRDVHGNYAKITANTIVANPDFQKIKESNFQHYFFESFSDTFKNRDGHDEMIHLIKQGIENKIYQPQLHGREHLSIKQWLHALENSHNELTSAFHEKMFGISLNEQINKRNNVMAALDFESLDELENHKKIIIDGQRIFQDTFGFESKTFIAPCYVWHKAHETFLMEAGVSTLQGIPYQFAPNLTGDWFKTSVRYTGKKSKSGLSNIVRNAFFEPSLVGNGESVVYDCMKRIDWAFKTYKPAIIGSHRINFMGSLSENNRKQNLKYFKTLLKLVTKKWPDVEFMSSDELADLMNNT
ncbi:polysaccharide (de)acetylase [Polaribacter litorisediminis]|uniref:polysaccharide (de)acetylase n=1 Tax=Polaribacter litorisediminis TaxID=1908341 RepID=UPI001CC03DB3|nr:polysaccharide (de)acetylase [Polaribacter litorisediminis]UAM96614.1 polysaccharide (de)acetylase [Polaribacter litorisediminis]